MISFMQLFSAVWGHAGLLTTCVLNYDTEGENRNHNITEFRGLQVNTGREVYRRFRGLQVNTGLEGHR